MEQKNYGLIIPPIETREQGAEHILGALDKPIINESGNWLPYVIEKEPQSRPGIDIKGCAFYATLNALERKLKFLGYDVNYSERYLILESKRLGKTDIERDGGADPHIVAELIRQTTGLLREDKLPWFDDVRTIDDYYNVSKEILIELFKEGQAWYKDWKFEHEWVFGGGGTNEKRLQIQQALQKGTVCASAYAWVRGTDGKYIKPAGTKDNHWIEIVNAPVGKYDIFDSYDAFYKELDPLYDFSIVKVYYLNKIKPQATPEQISIFRKILSALAQILQLDLWLLKKKTENASNEVVVQPIAPEVVDDPKPPENAPEVPRINKLEVFAKAIQSFEGWYSPGPKYPLGSLSWINNNPGNLKYTPLTVELGAIDKDQYNLCIFNSYKKGYNALYGFIKLAGENKLKRYRDCSILTFFQNYATGNQINYANFVAKQLEVSIETKVASLIS